MLVLTSWDDGHPCDIRIAGLLDKHGLSGTFFVPVSNREGKPVLDDARLLHLDQGFEIGGHTLTHRYLDANIDPETMRHEIFEGKRILEERVGHEITGFCYPGGRYNDLAVRTVMDAGFRYARTTENLRMDLGNDCRRLPTTVQFYPHTALVLAQNTLRYPDMSKLPLVAMKLCRRDFVPYCIGLAERCAAGNGVFHLWGHSWEIEQHQLWSQLETVLKALAGMLTETTTLAEIFRATCTSTSAGVHTIAERR